jgi:hypothetical protein
VEASQKEVRAAIAAMINSQLQYFAKDKTFQTRLKNPKVWSRSSS